MLKTKKKIRFLTLLVIIWKICIMHDEKSIKTKSSEFQAKNGNIYGLEFLLFENKWFTNIAKWFYDTDRRIDFPPISSNLSLLSNFIYDDVCWNEAKLLLSEYFRYNLFTLKYSYFLMVFVCIGFRVFFSSPL